MTTPTLREIIDGIGQNPDPAKIIKGLGSVDLGALVLSPDAQAVQNLDALLSIVPKDKQDERFISVKAVVDIKLSEHKRILRQSVPRPIPGD